MSRIGLSGVQALLEKRPWSSTAIWGCLTLGVLGVGAMSGHFRSALFWWNIMSAGAITAVRLADPADRPSRRPSVSRGDA